MPEILEFSFKNVCSYGNKLQKVPFSGDPQLMLIVGENGAGKSTIGNALEFSWYGKTRKRRIKDLANRINGGLETYNKFKSDDGRIVEIARGISPSYFELKVNGVPDNKAGKGKANKYIEEELLNLPFEVCTNTMILSINDFKSFVKINAEDKRKIVDRIFGMDVLNKMNVMLKEDMKKVKDEIERMRITTESKEAMLDQSETQLVELRKDVSEKAEERKKFLESKLAELDSKMSDTQTKISEISERIAQLEKARDAELNELNDEYDKVDTGIVKKISELEFKYSETISDAQKKIKKAAEADLAALDAQYKEKIDNLTQQAESSAADAKTALDAEISAIKKEYDEAAVKFANKRDEEIDNIKLKHISKLESIEDNYKDEIAKLNTELESENTRLETLESELQSLLSDTNATTVNNASIEDKLSLYEKGICPECKSDLTTHDHVIKRNKLEEELELGKKKRVELEGEYSSKNKEGEEIRTRIAAISEKIHNAEDQLKIDNSKLADARETDIQAVRARHDEGMITLGKERDEKMEAANSKYRKNLSDANEINSELSAIKQELGEKKEKINSDKSKNSLAEYEKYNAELNEKRGELQKNRDTLHKEHNEKQSEISKKYPPMIADMQNKKSDLAIVKQSHESEREMHDSEMRDLNDKSKVNESIAAVEKIVEATKEELLTIGAERASLDNDMKLYIATQELLLEDGVKKKFMGTVLPAMNSTISYIISKLEYKFNFRFDNDFNAIIEHMGNEVSPESLSTGEEKMIDLIVVLAVMELIQMKHPNVNVMFLDEVFASLDQVNIERVIKILREFMDKYDMTLFAISHTMMPKEHFDKIITVSNDGMFSDIHVD